MKRICNCETKQHFTDNGDGPSRSGNPQATVAWHDYCAEITNGYAYPAQFVGDVCLYCATGHLREYLTPAGREKLHADMFSENAAAQAVREWLLGYAWAEDTPEQKAAVTDCIMNQDDWHHVDALADKFAGAQWEPGPAAFDEGVQFALSALYECHSEPHLVTCPYYRD